MKTLLCSFLTSGGVPDSTDKQDNSCLYMIEGFCVAREL